MSGAALPKRGGGGREALVAPAGALGARGPG